MCRIHCCSAHCGHTGCWSAWGHTHITHHHKTHVSHVSCLLSSLSLTISLGQVSPISHKSAGESPSCELWLNWCCLTPGISSQIFILLMDYTILQWNKTIIMQLVSWGSIVINRYLVYSSCNSIKWENCLLFFFIINKRDKRFNKTFFLFFN